MGDSGDTLQERLMANNSTSGSIICNSVDVAYIDHAPNPEDLRSNTLNSIPNSISIQMGDPINGKSPSDSREEDGTVVALQDHNGVMDEERAAFIPAAAVPSGGGASAALLLNRAAAPNGVPDESMLSNGPGQRRASHCSSVSVGSLGVPVLAIPPQQEPPDGGLQAWLVMFASFFCNGIIFGTINSSGIIFNVLHKDLEANGVENPSAKASLCLSLTIGMTFLMSMASGVLIDKLGVRTTTFVGGGLATLGMFLSSIFYQQIEYLTLTFGVLLGIGFSLAYTPSLVILGHYFRRRMGIVNGFVTAGSSLFTILMPMLFEALLNSYGLMVLLQVLSALLSLLMVCAFIFKPRLAVLPPEPSSSKYRDSTSSEISPRRCKACLQKTRAVLASFINFDIWHNRRYVIWAVCIPLALFGYFVPYVHLVAYTKAVLGEDVQAHVLVQCIGATSGIGRILFGYLADQPWVDRIMLQQISFFCIGGFMMLLTAWPNFWFFLVIALGMGLFDGCFISLLGPVAFDIVGPAGAPQAIGSLLTLCSVPLTFGPYVAGLLQDHLGSYFVPFLVSGIPPIVGAMALFAIRCVRPPPQGAPGSPVREALGQQNNAAPPPPLRRPSNVEAGGGLLQPLTLVTENGCSSSGAGGGAEASLQHADVAMLVRINKESCV